jgi:gamma-glutamylcyclotransferase (GGCT)/AIG2-like uncharacterized protein YtfP
MEQLFVYGTLQLPDVQQRILGRVVNGTPDTLEGFTRGNITLGVATYFIAVEQAGASIDGIVLELTPDELERADRYETDDYRRFRVMLRSGKEVWVYGK